MILTLPKWLVWFAGVCVAFMATIVPLSLVMRRRRPAPKPQQPTTGEAVEATAVDERARAADAVLTAAAKEPDESKRRDDVAGLVGR